MNQCRVFGVECTMIAKVAFQRKWSSTSSSILVGEIPPSFTEGCSPFFLTDAQLQQSGFYLVWHLEQQVSSPRTASNARHECFGCPRSYLSLSPSVPDNLQTFLFLQALWCSKVSKQVIALHWIDGRGSTQLLQPLNLRGKLRLHSATALPPATASPTWHPSDLLYSNGSAGSGSGWFRASSRLKTRYLGVWRLQILKACLLEAPKKRAGES